MKINSSQELLKCDCCQNTSIFRKDGIVQSQNIVGWTDVGIEIINDGNITQHKHFCSDKCILNYFSRSCGV